jgi:hypothetical protein
MMPMTLGCESRLAASASFDRRARCFRSYPSSPNGTLIAKRRDMRVCCARYTRPMPPSPITLSM